MSVSTWPGISHLSISTPELVNILRQMGQQVKWPQKMKAPDSFRNPGLWCDFHCDHGHKTEDCVALRIEVNELLQKRQLWEFLSEKAKNHLNKEVPVKSAGAITTSPGPSDPCHIRKFRDKRCESCSCQEKHPQRQAQPGDNQTKALAPRYHFPPSPRQDPDLWIPIPETFWVPSIEYPGIGSRNSLHLQEKANCR
ncbi:hypothetical protein F2Q69_00042115 [Brassica cretica]|uniref:Uncharacterized protein n=1 Tax=Brassica cretica TaxID=69181 RepID=A0A8S9NIP5_BRACR|nr:hypothetical protein F2Q69_00042115 [Brassica cretica]